MLPDRLLQLLTAYVDGELSARQRRSVLRLLKRSPEARGLLQELRGDAARLRDLPRARLGSHFAQRIVRAVSPRPVYLPRRPAADQRPPFPAWLGLASAAAVLLLVGVSSYVYFAITGQAEQTQPAVVAQADNTPQHELGTGIQPGGQQSRPIQAQDAGSRPGSQPSLVVWAIERAGRWGTEQVVRLTRDGKKSLPESDPVATRNSDPGSFDIVNERGLLLLNVRELGQENSGRQLREELGKDSACRIELFCLENAKAFARLQAAFKAHGIRLLIDKDAQTCLNRRLKTSYVLYAEDLTSNELAAILQEVGNQDKKAEARREAQFDRIIINALSAADYKELSNLLGIDAKLLQARPKMDPRRPLSDRTAEEVIRVLEGQGPQRPIPGKPVARVPERLALVLASNLVRPRSASKEIKLFTDSRKDRRPGTVQMVLVLHEKKV